MDFLRGRPRPDGAEPPNRGAGLRTRRDTETALLEAWAAERGLILPWSVWKRRFRPGGAEHDVFQDAASQRWFKVTKGGGLVIDSDSILGKQSQQWLAIPFVRDGTPCEYLERLVLFNDTFGDDIQLIGVTRKDDGEFALITSQPHVRGRPATNDEVADFMAGLGFTRLRHVQAGRHDSESFFRPSDSLAVFDTHGENFLWYEGMVFPIDSLICVADPEMAAFLSLTPTARRRETPFRSRLATKSSRVEKP